MPVLRYFVFVGGALLALLLVVNACLPALPATEGSQSAAVDLPTIRIHSDRKWPDRIVFDTTRPTIVPNPALSRMAQAPQPPNPAVQPNGQAREAFAQLRTNGSRNSEPRRKRRTVARNRYAAPRQMMVAQQPRFGFFGGNVFGNNVW